MSMEKDERIRKIVEDVKNLTKIQKETEETRVSLVAARKEAEETKTRSELYSRLEKASGVKIATLTPTSPNQDPLNIERKLGELLGKETELKKQILASLSDESKFPFGIEEPIKRNEDIMFPIKNDFQIEGDVLKVVFDLIDANYPARFNNVVIDTRGILVERQDLPDAANEAAAVLERLRATAKTLSEMLFDESKLQNLCGIIYSSEKSYRPIVEEIGNHYPNPTSNREIADKRNMRIEAVASITNMLLQGKNWAGKCSILKRTEESGLTLNSLGKAIWNSYQKLHRIPQEFEQRNPGEKQRSLINFSNP
jgi:hypothetical protein